MNDAECINGTSRRPDKPHEAIDLLTSQKSYHLIGPHKPIGRQTQWKLANES